MAHSHLPPRSEQRPIDPLAAGLALLCAALWGGTAVAIRFTQDALPPVATAAWRFLLSCGFLYGWCLWENVPLRLRRGQLGPVLAVGGLLFVQIALFHLGLTRTNSAHGSVLIGSFPVAVAVVAHFSLAGDRLSWSKAAGIALATVGVVVLVGGAETSPDSAADPATLLGDLLVLTSSILLAVKTVYTKHALAQIEPGKLLFWSNLCGTALMFAYSGLREQTDYTRLNTTAIAGLLYQGLVVAGFCFAMWTALLRRHRASELAVFSFAQPLFGIAFGYLLRGDSLGGELLLGTAAVALGILLVTRAGDL